MTTDDLQDIIDQYIEEHLSNFDDSEDMVTRITEMAERGIRHAAGDW